jgi:hypothetical protein
MSQTLAVPCCCLSNPSLSLVIYLFFEAFSLASCSSWLMDVWSSAQWSMGWWTMHHDLPSEILTSSTEIDALMALSWFKLYVHLTLCCVSQQMTWHYSKYETMTTWFLTALYTQCAAGVVPANGLQVPCTMQLPAQEATCYSDLWTRLMAGMYLPMAATALTNWLEFFTCLSLYINAASAHQPQVLSLCDAFHWLSKRLIMKKPLATSMQTGPTISKVSWFTVQLSHKGQTEQ